MSRVGGQREALDVIKVEVHSCGRLTYVDEFTGLTIRTDTEPLEADGATKALLGGAELYRVYFLGGRPSRYGGATPDVLAKLRTEPGERPLVVRAHRCTEHSTLQRGCTAVSRPNTPSPVPSAQPVPPSPSAGRTETPSPGPQTEPFSVPGARPTATRSDGRPTCSACGRPCADGTYASIALGELTVWAQHVEQCTA